MATKIVMVKLPRSAKNGQFVTANYAKKHPSTTVIQTVKKSK